MREYIVEVSRMQIYVGLLNIEKECCAVVAVVLKRLGHFTRAIRMKVTV